MAGITPKKSLGQNFLKDQNIARNIVELLNLSPDDTVIEIGPGTGALTKRLINKGADLIAIEIDRRAVDLLKKEYNEKDIKIISDDFLKTDITKLVNDKETIKIIGNLPYYVSSQILFHLFNNAELLDSAVIMLQKEVAMRICSPTRTKDYGILTVATELSSLAQIMFHVSPTCFYPEPKVWSSVVFFDFAKQRVSREKFRKIMVFVRAAFNQRRKKLKNSLKNYIEKNTKLTINQYIEGLKEDQKEIFAKRAEELTADDFVDLYEQIADS